MCDQARALGEPLKPCPFCGSDDLEVSAKVPNFVHVVVCTNCGAFGPSVNAQAMPLRTRVAAVAEWNERTDNPQRNTLSHSNEAST